MPRLHVITGHGRGPLFTLLSGLAGAAAVAALAWFLLGGVSADADIVGAPVDVPASAGTAPAFPQTRSDGL